MNNLNKIESSLLSPEEALALFIQTDLTKDKYITLRSTTKNTGHNVYPSYDKVQLAMKFPYSNLKVIF